MMDPAPGMLLIAEPFLKDPNFMRTVVLLCRHEPEEGTFGFVLNKPFHQTLDELIPGMEGFPIPINVGGPVQIDTLHYIHDYPDLLPDSQLVADNIYWGGDFETLKALIQSGEITEDRIRFFLGYSGWGKAQLDTEMNEKTWLTVTATREIVFGTHEAETWKAALRSLGGRYAMMVHFPTDPQLN